MVSTETEVASPGLNIPSVIGATSGATLTSNRKLYMVAQRIALAFGFSEYGDVDHVIDPGTTEAVQSVES